MKNRSNTHFFVMLTLNLREGDCSQLKVRAGAMRMIIMGYSLLIFLIALWYSSVDCAAASTFAFVSKASVRRGIDPVVARKSSMVRTFSRGVKTNNNDDDREKFTQNYRDMIASDFCHSRRSALNIILGCGFARSMISSAPAFAVTEEDTLPVLKTSSGLKYIDLVPGTGISPSYGNLVSIAYTAYVKLPTNDRQYSTQPQRFDHSDAYLIKHGNGRMIAGLDEGIHTMKVGGTRRILIPPKLGFVDIGLGPLPDLPWNRYALNQLLDQMVELSGGTVIYEVTLRSVIPDEADLGYYSDASLSPEDFATLRENLRVKGNEGRMREEAAAAAATTKGQDRML